jgi:hypothetical protein
MRKSDFGAVYSTIAACLEDGEIVGIIRIEDDAVHSFLDIC